MGIRRSAAREANATVSPVEPVKKYKEAAGSVLGQDDLAREGRAQQDKAEAQRDAAKREAEADAARGSAEVAERKEESHQRK
ncbi:CsbD family protein [Candidatus Mycobacterium methanotrophicum]|uniref:CsbD family protein n=1 Tax=Candidatus Mycobacterium methanotrophicum TaxID=2943498 RepID=A0ABY4QHE9_9MYCO|nr:CsbD family protein [Candidatus Mycobacterium methanotrophicum]UQX10289.1 CsbD family protein [Candidatus Mycobacterium methanotrophicum]